METLQTVDEGESQRRHRRGWSIGTWSSAAPTTDGHSMKKPLIRSTTAEASEAGDDRDNANKKGKKGKKGKKDREEPPSAHLDPDKDKTDPTPFREKPSRLAMLVDPKSLDDLEKIGGIDGLLEGLGVDGAKGLAVGTDEGNVETGAPRSSADMPGGNGPQWRASMDQRRKIYGHNDLPHRKSKSLLTLMWLAFKDKVLVSFSRGILIDTFLIWS